MAEAGGGRSTVRRRLRGRRCLESGRMPQLRTDDVVPVPDFDARVQLGIPLVHYAVNDLVPRLPAHVQREDLISAGFLGLAQAARSWDAARNVTFERYARTRIRGALLDELRGRDWATRSVRGKARHLTATTEELARRTGQAPSDAELARTMGLTTAELAHLKDQVHRTTVLPFDAIFADPSDAPATSADEESPIESVLHRERLDYLREAVTHLPERLRKVVIEYFFEQRQMQDIANDLGVTESRVSQLRAEAIVMLRAGMAPLVSDDEPDERSYVRPTPRLAAYLAEVASASNAKARLASRPSPAPARTSAIA
jgi:RNA polymerase sigma factor for flagellar operon FliA